MDSGLWTADVAFSTFAAYPHRSQNTTSFSPVSAGTINSWDETRRPGLPQELHGRHVQKVELGAQWQFLRDVFARLRWNAGNVFDRWTWDPAGYVDGFGIELGAKTVAGRLNLSASGSGHTRWPREELDLGLPF